MGLTNAKIQLKNPRKSELEAVIIDVLIVQQGTSADGCAATEF